MGKQAADELVEWLNAVHTASRSDLRELNELSFARFNAEQRERWAELRAWIDARLTTIEADWRERDTERDAEWRRDNAERDARLEKRFAQIDERFAQIDARFGSFETRVEMRFAQQEAKTAHLLVQQSRFLYLSLATQVALILGLYFK